MELFIALVLFIGMIACWFVLPSGAPSVAAHTETDAMSHSAVRQPI